MGETDTISSCVMDEFGFPKSEPSTLAYLGALIVSQAERDGASGIRFHYGTNRMIYVLGVTDYEMVPPPAPIMVDLAKGMARASRTCFEKPGKLELSFWDKKLTLSVHHGGKIDDRYLELTGFSGSFPNRIEKANPREKE